LARRATAKRPLVGRDSSHRALVADLVTNRSRTRPAAFGKGRQNECRPPDDPSPGLVPQVFGRRNWILAKTPSSTQAKLAASVGSPEPVYCGSFGKGQSGRVIRIPFAGAGPPPGGDPARPRSDAKAREVAFRVAQPGCGARREHMGEHLRSIGG